MANKINRTRVTYSESLDGQTAEKVEYELLSDVIFGLQYNGENGVIFSMADKITDNTQLEGFVDYDLLNITIRWLTRMRNQIKENNQERAKNEFNG